MEIQNIAVSKIHENPDNPRKKLGDLTGLIASIKSIGLIEPIVVREVKRGSFVIVSGARRFAACKKLKLTTVPCVVRPDATNEDLAAIAENTVRQDLSVQEVAAAVARLEGLDMTDEEIARSIDIDASNVEHARSVARAPKSAQALLKKVEPADRQFTLEESAILVRFADDAQRAKEIARELKHSPDQLPHLIAGYEADDAHDALVVELRASVKGQTQIKEFNSWERPPDGAEPLANLVTGAAKRLTVLTHRDCPFKGFMLENEERVYWRKESKPTLVHYCTDWQAAGHALSKTPKYKWPTKSSPKAVPKKDLEERRRVIANNKAWGPATTVRTKWLDEFALRGELNPAAKLWVLSELSLEPGHIAPILNETAPDGFEAKFVFVWRQLVKYHETELTRNTWRPGPFLKATFDRYIRMLEEQGYPVSDVEQLLLDKSAVAA